MWTRLNWATEVCIEEKVLVGFFVLRAAILRRPINPIVVEAGLVFSLLLSLDHVWETPDGVILVVVGQPDVEVEESVKEGGRDVSNEGVGQDGLENEHFDEEQDPVDPTCHVDVQFALMLWINLVEKDGR